MRCFECSISDQHDLCIVALFETFHPIPLFIQQIGRDFNRKLGNHFRCTFFARLFANDAQNRECQGLGAANGAKASATRTSYVRRFADRWTQSLSRHLQQTEAADLADLHPGAILVDGVAQTILNIALILLRSHIDKVDHDQAAKIANTQLTRNLIGRFEVGVQSRCFDVTALGRACRVDVNRYHRLGVIDDNTAACRQCHFVCKRRFDLRLDLETREQRHRVIVMLQLAQIVRHCL